MFEVLSIMPWGEIRFAEGIQIAIGIVTILVTVSIYVQQKKSAELQEKNLLVNKANQFAINNQEEMGYLPLCVLASDVHRREKHIRKIYLEFCRCSDELQAEIIEQEEKDKIIHVSNTEIQKWITLLKNDIENFNLGRNLLYDGAKYFTWAYERYRQEPWLNPESECVFERILPCSAVMVAFGKDKITFSNYVEEYIKWENSSESENGKEFIPPIDYMCQETHWQNVDEKTACMWVLEVMRDICVAMYKGHSGEYEENDFVPLDEVEIKTFEDMYYITIQWLYAAYGRLRV